MEIKTPTNPIPTVPEIEREDLLDDPRLTSDKVIEAMLEDASK